ncbi:MAG: hypothetical protein JNM93_11150 [Bacteriovoracaceae bacterium]|nr:hypothetical protein [Bacteriovoracaceae bacterium]
MKLKLQQIGNSVGVIIPKEEITKRNYQLGDFVEIEFSDDPFWKKLDKYSKKTRQEIDKNDSLSADDLKEWDDI